MDLGISGLASGFDWRSFVDQVVQVERAPQQNLLREQNTIQQKKIAFGSISTQLAVLQNRIQALKDPALFSSRTVQNSSEAVGQATASATAPLGTFEFNISQLATASSLQGSSDIGAPISSTDDVSGVILGSAGFSRAITAGTFTVNGAKITLDTSSSLQDVFNAIESATGGSVTANYDSSTDAITLTAASGELVLGSATDTSNFLSVAKLYNNGTSSSTSGGPLGSAQRSTALASANLRTAIDDGGSGAGVFQINGVDISFSASTDTLNSVIDRINNSDAGVLASYDQVNDRILLTNKQAGDLGISVTDVTGNFAAATGLSSGTLTHGQNLLYSINGGDTLVSTSNTISEESSGIAGLSVAATGTGTLSVSVGSDTNKIKTAIKDFLSEYNKLQSIIDSNTASSTDDKGKVTAGTLANDSDANSIASLLRSNAFNAIDAFASSMNQLADIGIDTNGNDNSLTLSNEDTLDAALTNNLAGVQKLFTDSTDGIANKLDSYVDGLIGDNGSLKDKDTKLAKDIANIDTQLADMERLVQDDRQRLLDSFVQMETAQAQIKQQAQFLTQRFGGGSSTG